MGRKSVTQMKLAKREDGWWVTDLPFDGGDCGPYKDRGEADEHRTSLQRTYDNLDNWSFWTTEPKPGKTATKGATKNDEV